MKKLFLCLVSVTLLLITVPAFAESKTLTWTDNSTNEDGFLITRRESVENIARTVGATLAGVTTFVDSNLVAGKTYFWKVYAYNLAGVSGASNEVTATIPSAPAAVATPDAAPTLLK